MKRKRYSEDVYRDERRYAAWGWSDQAILAQLVKDYGDAAPRLRGLRRHLAEFRQVDDSGPWRINEAPESEVRVVLDYQRDHVESSGLWKKVTKAQGRWMATVSRAAPGLSTFLLYELAREYIRRWSTLDDDADVNPALDLDAWVAFTPWRSDEDRERYESAVSEGLVPYSTHGMPDVVGADWFHTMITTELKPVPGGFVTSRRGDRDGSQR